MNVAARSARFAMNSEQHQQHMRGETAPGLLELDDGIPEWALPQDAQAMAKSSRQVVPAFGFGPPGFGAEAPIGWARGVGGQTEAPIVRWLAAGRRRRRYDRPEARDQGGRSRTGQLRPAPIRALRVPRRPADRLRDGVAGVVGAGRTGVRLREAGASEDGYRGRGKVEVGQGDCIWT